MDHDFIRRHDLLTTVRCLRTVREKDRSDSAFDQLENERDLCLLCDELSAARRETEVLKDQHESLARDHKNILGFS